MSKVTTSPLARRVLGRGLAELRNTAGKTPQDVQDALRCSPAKASKLESGQHTLQWVEVERLLDLYGVAGDDPVRETYADLNRLARKKGGWWSELGSMTESDRMFLAVEADSTKVRTYESDFVPGLFQTEDYARAITRGLAPELDDDEVERRVRFRMQRQQRILHTNPSPPAIRAVLAESVLRWRVGGTEVWRAQLEQLLKATESVLLQVLPFRTAAHAGMRGSMTILEFSEEIYPAVAYTEGQAGNVYMEKAHDVERCTVAYEHLTAAALSRPDSTRLIRSVLQEE